MDCLDVELCNMDALQQVWEEQAIMEEEFYVKFSNEVEKEWL